MQRQLFTENISFAIVHRVLTGKKLIVELKASFISSMTHQHIKKIVRHSVSVPKENGTLQQASPES